MKKSVILHALPECLGSQLTCFYWALGEDGWEQMEEKWLLQNYNHFSQCLFASFLNLVFKINRRVKNMKYSRHSIYVENSVIYKLFSVHFISWQRGRPFKIFELIPKELEFAVTPDTGEGCSPDTKGGWGVYLCVDQDGWRHFPSTFPPSALLMTSALAWGTNIP